MSYSALTFDDFGIGLNLRDKHDAVEPGAAIDALNVIFTERDKVRQRDGYDALGSALTNAVASLEPFYRTGANNQLVAGCGTRLEALDTAGAVVASLTGLTTGTWDFARIGLPNNEYLYAGQGNDTLRRWDGTSWTAPASMPAGGALALMSGSNRLVNGRFNITTGGPTGGASTSSPSHVYFSDAGLPETWGTNNYVQLTPGDGEKVQGIVAWRDSIFVFKETKFFIFPSQLVSTDSSGNPVFNYRTMDTGVGLVSPRALCSTRDGVYFMDRTGVYLTDGAAPRLVSELIQPIFSGGPSEFYLGGTLAHGSITNSAMAWHDEKLYLAFTSGSANDRVLVHDPRYGWWSIWDVPASCLASFRVSNAPELVFGYASGLKHVGRFGAAGAYTNDDGAAITSRWRSGWFELGNADVKTFRSRKFWGSGKCFTSTSKDFQIGTFPVDALDFTSAALSTWSGTDWGAGTWEVPVSLKPELVRRAVRGTYFSTYFTNSILDQSWAIHRVEHHQRQTRRPTIKQLETA